MQFVYQRKTKELIARCKVYVYEPGKKTFGAKTRTNNKLNPRPGSEPGSHWWEASALTTAPFRLPLCDHSLEKFSNSRVNMM